MCDDAALAAAEALIARHDRREFLELRLIVPRLGMAAAWGGGTLRDLARDVIAIAKDGLRARARLNGAADDETMYLAPLEAISEGEPSQSEKWLERYNGAWNGDITRIFNCAVC